MRPFGLIFTVMFLVSAFSESRTVDCRVLLGDSVDQINQSKNHGVNLRSEELLGVVIHGYRKLRWLSAAGERMHTMASGPSRRGAETTISAMKPSRSDEVQDPEEQIKNANQIRADFDSLAPKRPTKPTRSEPGLPGSFSTSDKTNDHPEEDKFRSLQSQPHGNILGEGDLSKIQDEFSETEYYTNLTSIDKQHHTTGSGFINVAKEDGGEETVTVASIGDRGQKTVYRSNPATNEWVPAAEEEDFSESSSKPNRSESS